MDTEAAEHPKVLVTCPAYRGSVHAQTVESLIATCMDLASTSSLVGLAIPSHTSISDVRSMLLTTFHDATPATHLLMVDADMVWSPELVRGMLGRPEPVVGTLYPSRNVGYPTIGRPQGSIPTDGWGRADAVGAGVLLIGRSAVTTLLAHQPALSQSASTQPVAAAVPGMRRVITAFAPIGSLSEDLSFCSRIRAAGMDIGCWGGRGVGHIGEYVYSMRDTQ